MLVDVVQRKNLSPFGKVLWLLFIFCTGIAALVYFLIYAPKLNRKSVWFKVAIYVAILACLPAFVTTIVLLFHM